METIETETGSKVKPPQRECPHCGWTWTPYKPSPKYCPGFKRPLELTEKQKRKLIERTNIKIEALDFVTARSTLCQECVELSLKGQLQGVPPYAIGKLGDKFLCEKHLIEELKVRAGR
jgi:hypothetical protein